MSEFFETTRHERELYAAMEATEAKRDRAGVELATAIWAHGPGPSTAEAKARDQLLEIIRQENAARSAWAKVYRARMALKTATIAKEESACPQP